jgi:hypothetical protein
MALKKSAVRCAAVRAESEMQNGTRLSVQCTR